jgi:hypothetical protein
LKQVGEEKGYDKEVDWQSGKLLEQGYLLSFYDTQDEVGTDAGREQQS